MARKLIMVAALTALALVGAGSASAAKKPPSLWTESYAEQTLMKKMRLPCKVVRLKLSDCNVAAAQAAADKAQATVDEALPRYEQEQAACYAEQQKLLNPNFTRCNYYITSASNLTRRASEAKLNLELVSKGYPLVSAECIGMGSAIRFAQLRCKVTVEDGQTNVWGRFLVDVRGKTAFRWSAI